MAIIKAISSKANIKNIIEYVTKESKTTDSLTTGKDCMSESCLEEMEYVKQLYKKTDGRQYIHLIQSFSPEENTTKEEIHKIGLKLAEVFVGHQILVATHIDKQHLHNHLVINSVSFEDGRKIQMSKKDLQDIKNLSDELCRQAGLFVVDKKEYSSYMNMRQYKVAEKGESWKFKLINAIDNSMQITSTKEDFIQNMNKLGYEVKWTDTRKNVTYTTPEGMKCRDNKLYDPKYLKEEMENGFREIKREQSNIKSTTNIPINNKTRILPNRARSNQTDLSMGRICKAEYSEYKRNNYQYKTRASRTNKRYASEDETGYSRSSKRGIYQNAGQAKTITGGTENKRYEAQNQIAYKRSFDRFSNLLNIFSYQEINNSSRRQIRGYKGSLSKQAMKEYAIRKANASGFNWEANEEEI